MLRVNNVEVKYLGVILVLRGIFLAVDKGSVVALLGANGAGKSTTLKAISGMLKTEEGEVTDGNIEFEEKRIDRLPPEEIVKRGIIQVLEGRRVLEHLTVEENLKVGAYSTGDGSRSGRNLDMVYSYFPRIKELRNRTSGYLSGGEQQMLVVGRAMMAKPKLIMLDEASLGLAPLLVREIFEIIKRINSEEDTAFLVVEQNAMAALSVAEYGYVIENGRIVLDGPSDKLKGNEDIREFYMGLSEVGEKKSYKEVKHYKRRKRWLA